MPLPLFPTSDLDITDLSRQGLLVRAQTLATQVNPNWEDFSLGFSENILLEAMAMMIGMAADTQNERVRQLSWATVTDRLAAIRNGKVMGFQLSPASAAQTAGLFSLPNSGTHTKLITIPAGTKVQTGDYYHQTLVDVSIAIGNTSSSAVTVENSTSEEDTVYSDGSVNQVIQLDASPFNDGSLIVTCGDGTYLAVNGSGRTFVSFTEMGPATQGYIAMVDDNGRVLVLFGNGINGAIPQGIITLQYKTTDGEAGRITGTPTWDVLDTIFDEDGTPITMSFANTANSVGGFDAMTVEEARIRAPLSIRTQERSVNETDFEYAAGTIGGIARAAAMSSNHSVDVQEDNVHVELVAYGTPYTTSGYYAPAAPTSAQIAAVQALYEEGGLYPAVMGLVISSYAATFKDITVAVKIYKEANYTAAQVKASITDALQRFFAVADDKKAMNTIVDFGYKMLGSDGEPDYKVSWSKVLNAVNDATGVREISYSVDNLLLNGAHQSVILASKEFPRLSTITVYDMDNSGVQI